jgi:RNA methyltransferase, TrmH family
MITSTANAQVKEIRRLRERKARQESGLYYIEGLRIVIEAIQQSQAIDTLIVAPELITSPIGRQAVDEQAKHGVRVLEVSESVFKNFAIKENPQGIAAVVRQHWVPLVEVVPSKEDLYIALDAVQDPGNLGTILRTSDAVGGKGVILLDHSTDPFDLATVRGSMGAIFSQKLIKTTLAEFGEWKKRCKCKVIGTSGAAAHNYHQYPFSLPMVLLMGSERQGLTEAHVALCDDVVKIPMVGRSDSLNLAIATAVILYEVFNQTHP